MRDCFGSRANEKIDAEHALGGEWWWGHDAAEEAAIKSLSQSWDCSHGSMSRAHAPHRDAATNFIWLPCSRGSVSRVSFRLYDCHRAAVRILLCPRLFHNVRLACHGCDMHRFSS